MKKILKLIVFLAVLAVLAVIFMFALIPWMDRDSASAEVKSTEVTQPGSNGTTAEVESTEVAQPVSNGISVSLSEFGRDISLAYDPALASRVETGTVPAVPPSDQILFAEAHPEYAQIRFVGFKDGWVYDLPIYSENRVAQVMVFRSADFPGYGDDSRQGFVNQSQALTRLLQSGVDMERCAEPLMDYESALPFLPWTNSKQAFCAQAKVVEFGSGKGIRYLAYYAQDPSPALDSKIFYTFQGISDDGQFYVAAFFPVQTDIFPTEPPACPRCSDPTYDPFVEWAAVLKEQLSELNAQAEDDFSPTLPMLDELVKSITISQ
jgi:hypothetical protein